MWKGKRIHSYEIKLEYGGIWAISSTRGVAIVKLADWGYTCCPLIKRDGFVFGASDFATAFLKHELFENSYRKIEKDEVIPDEIVEIIKYNFEHAGAVYGHLHPGFTVEGVE